MIAGTILFGMFTFVLMLAAYMLPRKRAFHMPVMVFVMLCDLVMPFYLYATGDWYKRLIEQEELFTFLVWMHLGLVITLYVLYGLQIQAARKILRGEAEGRIIHREQAKVILAVKAVVLITGALLAPEVE